MHIFMYIYAQSIGSHNIHSRKNSVKNSDGVLSLSFIQLSSTIS